MLRWHPADDGLSMVLRKRGIEVARVSPSAKGASWDVFLNVHHPDDTGSCLARSKQQAMNVADMWANREGERLDREVGLVVNTGEFRLDPPKR